MLGYLAVRGLLAEGDGDQESLHGLSQEEGWDYLIRRIYAREAKQIAEDFIEPDTVRQFVERIATKARSSVSGLGPIHSRDMDDIFIKTFGVRSTEKSEAFLLRFPGFTSSNNSSADEREFVDEDFGDVCKAGDMVRLLEDPYNFDFETMSEANDELGNFGVRVLSFRADPI